MLHPFWQNLWTRCISLSLILGQINLIAPAFSQTKSQTLGVLETFKKLSKINRDKEQKILELSKKDQLDNFENILDIKINSTFLRSLLFFSKNKILDLISKNKCNFYALMENGLIGGDLDKNSIIPVIIKNNDNSIEKKSVSLKLFLDFIYNKKCPQYKEYSLLFSEKYFTKTFEKIDLKVGKTNALCKKGHNEWTKSPLIPYLCKIPKLIKEEKKIVKKLNHSSIPESENLLYEKIKEINLYKKEIKEKKKYYLKNLCDNIHSSEKFCSLYLSQDAWTKVVNKELPDYKLTYKCKQIFKSQEINQKQKRKCATLFNKNPKICSLRGQLGRTSLFPSSSCKESSNSLIKSKLYTNYHDCPSRIYNHSITNLFRIIMHFKKGKINNSSLDNCSFQSNKIFFTSIYREEYDDFWPLKMCYESKLSKKEECQSYIPGYDKNLPLAENRVLEGILKKTEPVLSDIRCLISNKNKFNPARINYKSGCHVIYDYKKCSQNTCSKKIIVNKKITKSITYKNEPKFNYHPSGVSNSSFSSVELTLERFNLKQKEITNLNQIKDFLKLGQGIIHGVGCIEEIYPSRFKTRSMNQCRPIPFIIDAIIEENFNYFLSIRTAIDDIHSPRLVNWSFIYNALKSYEGVHSINSWTLYGIEKNI